MTLEYNNFHESHPNSTWISYLSFLILSISEMATRLLKHFKSMRKVFQANKFDLRKVEGIGRVKSEKINQLLD